VTGDYTIVGKIRKPHGVHGELLVETMCDDPGAIFAPGSRVIAGDETAELLGGAVRELSVIRSRPFKGELLVTFATIDDRNAADEWRHRYLLVPTDSLRPPEAGEVWVHELPGMRVSDVSGAYVGDVTGVEEVPQGLLLEVSTARGSASIPFVEAIVVSIDREARTVVIDPPEGLLDL
jgi:16S rRNA processing protein RimM